MSRTVRRANPQPCSKCQIEQTSTAAGLCWRCRPAPRVTRRKDDAIVIDGLGKLTAEQALALAHQIADTLEGSGHHD